MKFKKYKLVIFTAIMLSACDFHKEDEIDLNRVNYLKELAKESFFNGDLERAYYYQDSVILLGQKNFNTYNTIGLYAKDLGKFNESKNFFLEAVKLSKNKNDSTLALLNLMSCLVKSKDYYNAIDYSNSFIPNDVFKFEWDLWKSHAYLRNGDYQNSVTILRKYKDIIDTSDLYKTNSSGVLKYHLLLAENSLALNDTLSYCTNYKIAYQLDTITANFLDSTICHTARHSL